LIDFEEYIGGNLRRGADYERMGLLFQSVKSGGSACWELDRWVSEESIVGIDANEKWEDDGQGESGTEWQGN
jgi:hypothetical protein